ncbi:GNAT family N-acetyltransferase [Methanobrevibacter sp.]|uniref:GNAT family N-acetyltransferase n=1 Tax=Methanobrevibacter sp. TaxID=66852 RepID=UPI003890C329
MIIKADGKDMDTILEYIGNDYGKCLYIYIDLKKYGFTNENFNVWIQYNKNGEICCIISEYYKGIQLFSKNYNLVANEISEFILQRNSDVIFGMNEVINRIKEYLPEFTEELGFVGHLTKSIDLLSNEPYSASLDEIHEIVELVVSDENIGKPYGFDSLYEQYYSRKVENFGRNFVLRDNSTNEIITHAGTYAELPELAILGGVITSIPYRGHGFSKITLSSLCNELKSEGKEIFSYYYIPSAKNMHHSIGFEEIGIWAKLIK